MLYPWLAANGARRAAGKTREVDIMKKTLLAIVAAVAVSAVGIAPALAADQEVPEYGTWQYFEAVETGSLPADYFDRDARIGLPGDKAPVIEVGGMTYRVGIDTQ
jgi:hypothetical protein